MQNKYHFIGIGGIGMSALARILLDKQIPVSGSDLAITDNTDHLLQKGAAIYQGHSAQNIRAEDTVVFNSQIQKNNPEYQKALNLKCRILHRSELLAQLMHGYETIAVTGTHGKTTTTSLLTTVLIEAGLDPTFAVGGMVRGLNGKLGHGKFFVAEADESDGTFLNYTPKGAIVTNIEPDHLDYYKTEEALKNAFEQFFQTVKDDHFLFYCGDDPQLTAIAKGKGLSYGFEAHNQLRIENYNQVGWSSFFDVRFEGKLYSRIVLNLIGEHNALNAAAVFGLSLRLGVSEENIRKTFQSFPGIGRRCEKRGEKGGILFVDDYGHHPTEIEKTIVAVKKAVQERRLVVLFQPHRFTRTRDLFEEFGSIFEMADLLYVTDIYGAMEAPIPGITGEALYEKIKSVTTVPCHFISKNNWCSELKAQLQPHDVFLTLGAGDVNRLHAELLQNFSPKKLKLGLIFGGRSCEHEISLRSSRFVAASLDTNLYDLVYFGIDKEGLWITGEEAEKQLKENLSLSSKNGCSFLNPHVSRPLEECDLLIPILHGTFGEDGTIQGFFEMLGKPYMGPDWRSAAICMDKALTKRIVEANGVKTPKDISFGRLQWLEHKKELMQKIEENLTFPVYVKPIHLGSSVGISCVEEKNRLEAAIELAFRYDTQVIVEEGKVGCRELEFAVMGNSSSYPVEAPAPGEKLAEGGFVDYEKKYGQNTVRTTLYPEMAPDVLEKGKWLARKAYEAVGCTGMTRVDFLLDEQGEFWMFEMNPIPGLQQFSLFPKIWNREGVEPAALFDRLIVLALERHRNQNRHFRALSCLHC